MEQGNINRPEQEPRQEFTSLQEPDRNRQNARTNHDASSNSKKDPSMDKWNQEELGTGTGQDENLRSGHLTWRWEDPEKDLVEETGQEEEEETRVVGGGGDDDDGGGGGAVGGWLGGGSRQQDE
jgi:hypothetical protein